MDEAFVGGEESNKHSNNKLKAGRGTVGKQAVLGVREQSGKVQAIPVAQTTNGKLESKIHENVEVG